jgi:hypothetical protein
MHMLRRPFASLALVVLATLTACGASAGVTGRWRDPNRAKPVHDVLVVGIAQRNLYRRLYEDEFVKRFAARGISAKASYLVVPGDDLTREQLEATVAEQKFDSVLLTHLVNIGHRREYKEGPTTATPYITSYGMGYYASPYYAPAYGPGFGTYYSAVYSYTQAEGYYETTKTYNLETALYSAKDSKLVWALMSQTVDPSNITVVIGEVADLVFNALSDDGML